MAEEKVAILGARGMLGSDLTRCCEQSYATTVLDLPEFDITNYQQLKEAVRNCSIIINCAAYTQVDKAESEAELAYKVNAEAVGQLGIMAKEAGIWVLHISTDFVFDGGSTRPYVETDHPRPMNTYGKSKLRGEQLLVESGCDNCIMRVEWTYGLGGNNFVTKLLARARNNKTVRVVDDQVGSPTATTEVARTICQLLPKKPQGVFHFANAGYVSRFEMAKLVMKKISLDVEIVPCRTSEFASPAARPLNSRFDCSKISALLDEPIKPWPDPLEDFLGRL
ncbi:MAG: dTDP-4-dehydrorhamnose reductase [Planctomycetota bacterium]|jgi:dTDP-4-dehydrorhamnose reductase